MKKKWIRFSASDLPKDVVIRILNKINEINRRRYFEKNLKILLETLKFEPSKFQEDGCFHVVSIIFVEHDVVWIR